MNHVPNEGIAPPAEWVKVECQCGRLLAFSVREADARLDTPINNPMLPRIPYVFECHRCGYIWLFEDIYKAAVVDLLKKNKALTKTIETDREKTGAYGL